jgi:hypothetical protein
MSHRPTISLLLCGFLFSTASLRVSQAPGGSLQKSAEVPEDASSATKIDVCALLTSAEIEAVQGEPIKETKPSEEHGSSFLMSQCFFSTATFAKSVSLALAMPNPAKPSALTPRKYWKKQFHPPEQPEKEKEKDDPAAGKAKTRKETEEEREKELSKPRVIDGFGEEAYWVGNPISGALYVLRGNSFLRISVGGVRAESERIEKSKALAHAALGRF